MKTPESYEEATRRGCDLLNRGEYQQAADAFRAALEQSPRNDVALGNLGIALMKLGQRGAAARAISEYLKLQPGDAAAWVRWGILLRANGQPADARKVLGRALLLDKRHATAWKELGLCYLEEGRSEEGCEALQRALTIKPDYVAACCALARHYEEADQPGPAIQVCTNGLHKTPTEHRGPIYGLLGMLYAQTGELDLARISLEEAIAQGEAAPALLFELGRVNLRLDQPEAAQRQWIALDSMGSEYAVRLHRLIDQVAAKAHGPSQ
ncbi:MAG: tetratricopeptide repeat protein [bacterium]|nr:tetratricopeptide repeat protein [bacterium]